MFAKLLFCFFLVNISGYLMVTGWLCCSINHPIQMVEENWQATGKYQRNKEQIWRVTEDNVTIQQKIKYLFSNFVNNLLIAESWEPLSNCDDSWVTGQTNGVTNLTSPLSPVLGLDLSLLHHLQAGRFIFYSGENYRYEKLAKILKTFDEIFCCVQKTNTK